MGPVIISANKLRILLACIPRLAHYIKSRMRPTSAVHMKGNVTKGHTIEAKNPTNLATDWRRFGVFRARLRCVLRTVLMPINYAILRS